MYSSYLKDIERPDTVDFNKAFQLKKKLKLKYSFLVPDINCKDNNVIAIVKRKMRTCKIDTLKVNGVNNVI